jgi:hypothetical protein
MSARSNDTVDVTSSIQLGIPRPQFAGCPPVSSAGSAVCRQRLRCVDLRNRLVPTARIRYRLDERIAGRPARDVHGRAVRGQPGPSPNQSGTALPSAPRIRVDRSRDCALRASGLVGHAGSRPPLSDLRRTWPPGNSSAGTGGFALPSGAYRSDGSIVARGSTMDRVLAAGNFVDGIALRREHRGSRGWISAGRILSPPPL